MPTLYISTPRSSLQYSQPTTPAFSLPKEHPAHSPIHQASEGGYLPTPDWEGGVHHALYSPLLYTLAHLFSDSSPPTSVPTSFYNPQHTLSSLPKAKPNPLTKKCRSRVWSVM
ncbi:hypothetical protein BT96DRAFT_1026545 [Gymnopus androsaceus JB14]|uniref:Uncharacterized protein n=1 Tax=Gymnopus androsaceus JB14 TaxID=1447944 RepID=A0A6A4GJT7_9AGAR|nr:hypothetical protein BT96DRAFT_1026545 [Gymnopus androsaceus JB14]